LKFDRRDWSSLPSELVDDIAVRVLRYDVTGYIRLRVACKEWRKCTANPRDLDIRLRHWTMLSNNTKGVRRRFLNLSTGACVHIDLQELSTHQVEASTEGLLLLRDKVSHAVRLLNPLTGTLTDLPPITAELGQVHDVWTEQLLFVPSIFYAGISEETSPATVVLTMRGVASFIAYAKPGDTQWALLSDCLLNGCIRHSSVSTLQGRVYLATYEGNILQVRVGSEPRLVLVVMDQPFKDSIDNKVISYLVPADDHRHQGMLLVRHYRSLDHLSLVEQRKMKCGKKMDVIRVETNYRNNQWHLIEVLQVDLDRERLVPVEDIGCHRALFVGDLVCFSLSTERFPSVAGNAVYIGANSYSAGKIGVRCLGDRTTDPPFQFVRGESAYTGSHGRVRRLVPMARPYTLQEYLVFCAGIKGGIKD
jgi:hypothetical protein